MGIARACAGAILTLLVARAEIQEARAQPAGRAVKVVYAFAAGNSGDALARILADRLAARLGNPFVVENRAGASARIGTRTVIAADPDGTTLLFSPLGPISLHPVVYTNLDFDPFEELAPISQVAIFDLALLTSASVSAQSVKELVAWLKANPDKANYGTPGLGGQPHFFAVMFATSAGVTLRNVPYRGGAAVLNDLVAGQLPIAVLTTADALAVVASGKAQVLATSGRQRSPSLDGVPTFREAGFEIEGEGWYGLYAPSKTPSDIVSRLSDAVRESLKEPATRERILGLGLVPTGTTPEELRRIQVADRAAWTPAVKASGFKPTD